MKEYLNIINVFFVPAVILNIVLVIKYCKQKKLFDLISWVVIGDYNPVLNRNSYVNDIIFEIINAQNNELINNQYKIIEKEDLKIVKVIIEEYQKNMTRLYFRGQLNLTECKYTVSKIDYFMATFHDFLSAHSCESHFLGYDMYIERKEYTSGEGYGYNATYVMSDFGIVYYKLYYITYMYCKYSAEHKNNVSCWAEKNIQEVLDKKEIKICCYRP